MRSTSRASPKRSASCTATARRRRQILIARRLVERGVRFVQVWHGEGQPWDNHDDLEVNHRKLAEGMRPADRRAAHRPQAARPARRDAGHLGRRVRPHADGRTARRRARTPARSTAATTTTTASPSGSPAAASKGATSTARPTSSASRRSRTRSTPRPARHDAATAGLRPRTLHLPLRRPRLPPDRRARREGDRGFDRVSDPN